MSVLKLNYTLPLLIITVLALGGVKAFYWFVEKQLEEGAPGQQSAVESSEINPVDATAKKVEKITDISAITRRNLFASREVAPPVEEIKPVLQEAVPSSLAVVLMGTVTGTDGKERAIIYDKKVRKQELYQEGDFLQQAAIKEIMRGKVIITLNGRDEILDITEARKVKVPQYKKPAVPTTSQRRVVGRPLSRRAAPQQQSGNEAVPEGLEAAVPDQQSPIQINSSQKGMIIKQRALPGQSEATGQNEATGNNEATQ